MRGKVAKRLRQAARLLGAEPTKYMTLTRNTGRIDIHGKDVIEASGGIFCVGYRKVYQRAKKEFNRVKRS